LTGDQRHRNDIINGQRVSRHADLPYVFLFFAHRTFFKNNFSQPTSGTFGFAPPASRPFAKPKEPLFSQRTDNNSYFDQIFM